MKSSFLSRIATVPALLLLTSTAWADDPAADRNSEEVKKQFTAGVNLLEDPDGAKYEEAYHAFKKAYELSKSPKVLGNVGYCALHLERDGEAIDAYTTYLRDVPDVSDSERAQIQRDLATLTSTVARLRVVVKRPPGSFVLIDTRTQTRGPAIENSYAFDGTELSLRVRPGRHTLKVKAADGESLAYDRTLDAGGTVALEVAFPAPKPAAPEGQPAPVRSSPSYAGPILFGVAGLLAVGAGVTSGLLARSKTSDIESECPNDVCPATYDLEANKDTAKLFGTVADIALISGGALLATAAVWYLLTPKGRASATGVTSPGLRSGMMCTGSGCAFQLGRVF